MSIRQRARDKVIEILNEDRAPEIPESTKRRWLSGRSVCPSMGVFFFQEDTEIPAKLGRHSPINNRQLLVAVQCVAAADGPDDADDLVEPMLEHAIARLGKAGQNLGGLALDVQEFRTKWETVQDDKFYIAATQIWNVNLQTRRDDLDRKQ